MAEKCRRCLGFGGCVHCGCIDDGYECCYCGFDEDSNFCNECGLPPQVSEHHG